MVGAIENNSLVINKANFQDDFNDLKWSVDGQNILVTSSNKLHLLQIDEKNNTVDKNRVFTHACSSKAETITAFTSHPKTPIGNVKQSNFEISR